MKSLAYSKMRTPPSINGYLCFGRFFRRKELRKRSEIATLAPAKIGYLSKPLTTFTRCTPVPDAFACFALNEPAIFNMNRAHQGVT